jgi:hypothetical protein
VEHKLELEVLDFQQAGIKLFAELAEFYHWLGERQIRNRMEIKLQEAVDNNLSTRLQLIDRYGYLIRPRQVTMSGEDKPKKTQLQWQEGTDEPEDEPNISNGVDTMPKKPPTRQPWEQPILPGNSYDSAPKDSAIIDRLYNEGLKRLLAYEKAAVELYQKMVEKYHDNYDGDYLYSDLLDEAKAEVEQLEEDLRG